MTEYTNETFGIEGQRNVVKEIEKILVDLNVVEPYKTRNNVVDFEEQDAFWYLRLTKEYLAKRASGVLEEIVSPALKNDNAQPSTPEVVKVGQEVKELRQQVEQLQRQMLLPSDNSPASTFSDSSQEPVDNNESEISQFVASEETRLDRDSNV